MGRYIAMRLTLAVVTVVGISIVVFALARLSGDATSVLIPPEAAADPEVFESMKRDLGLDRSYPEQYLIWIGNMMQGDFGSSLIFREPTLDLYAEKLPYTLRLAGVAFIVAVGLGIPIGVASALMPGSILDRGSMTFALLGQAAPSFFLAILLIFLFSVQLGWLPTSGPGGLQYYVMPALSLAWFSIAALARMTRSSMLEVLDREHIKLSRLNGVPEKSIIWRHSLKNATIPILTLASVQFLFFVSGSVVIETIFAWPGIGQLSITAIRSRDYPLVQTIVLLTSVMVVLINLLVDLTYAWIDPRIRYGNA